ncbi:uncharacterized protein PRCAT00004092001 [Priceomyces carsonii]|uniref:uncharacterized protein n=1 Tax=Priceomyces carsonii TaxID=28549 RepID=UPI002ED82B53|nr:unnamed protein product [Priceomyces carsonii]
MCPQWIPQNIQKRLLLYVLQQLSLFSEIDLPNLEEVSLKNVVLKEISIDPEKVGKLPGCNLRYGQVGLLELIGGVMGGVNIDAHDVDIVIAPDVELEDEGNSNVQFLLVQSTTDLANTIMTERSDDEQIEDTGNKDQSEENAFYTPEGSGNRDEEVDDIDLETKLNTNRSDSSSSTSKSKPSALSGVMTKAVEMALLRLQIKIYNLHIKIVSDVMDLLLEVDELVFNSINGTRYIATKGIRIVILRPDINTGDSGSCLVPQSKSNAPGAANTENSNEEDEKEEDEKDDEIDDSDDGYGDESLMNSMLFTHDEASSIYMSATSQSFKKKPEKDGDSHVIDNKISKEKGDGTVIAQLDSAEIEFEGLSMLSNIHLNLGNIKIAWVPLMPSVIAMFHEISKTLKIKIHELKKKNIAHNKLQHNSKFPQYSRSDEILDTETSTTESLDFMFNKIHIDNIVVSLTSSLLPDGSFRSKDNNFELVLHNLNIKRKNESLHYGGIEVLKMVRTEKGEQFDVFKFDSTKTEGATDRAAADANVFETASERPLTSGKADIRFEVFQNEGSSVSEFTTLFSKPASIDIESKDFEILFKFAYSIQTILEQTKLVYDAIETLKNLNHKSYPLKADSSSLFILQTAPLTISVKLSNACLLKAVIFPLSFNSIEGELSIQKVLISTIVADHENTLACISKIKLITRTEEFKSFVSKTSGHNSSFIPREVILSSSLKLHITKISLEMSLKDIKFLLKEMSRFADHLDQDSLFEKSCNILSDSGTTHPKSFPDRPISTHPSVYLSERRPKRRGANFTNHNSVINARRQTIASFRLIIDEIDIKVLKIKPEFGDFHFKINTISFHQFKDEIEGSLINFKIVRYKDGVSECFVDRFPKIDLQSPTILVHLKTKDKISLVEVIVRNIKIEYYTNWLQLLEDSTLTYDDVLENKVTDSIKHRTERSPRKRFDIRFTLHDCSLGLNPGRLTSKAVLVMQRGNSDVTFGVNQFYVKSSLRDISILLIDDLKNVKTSSFDSKMQDQNISYVSPLNYFLSSGFIVVGNVNCTHIGITVNTDIESIKTRNRKLGINESLALLDIKVNSDEHNLDLCADSFHTLSQLINDLKLPLNFKPEDKTRLEVKEPISLIKEIDEETYFKPDKDTRLSSDAAKDDDLFIIEGYVENHNLSSSLENNVGALSLGSESSSNNEANAMSLLTFEEDHFMKGKDIVAEVKEHPIHMNINLSKTQIYLYDGYDWKETRKAIKAAVKRIEAQAIMEINRRKEIKRENRGKKLDVKFKNEDEVIDDEPSPNLNMIGVDSNNQFEIEDADKYDEEFDSDEENDYDNDEDAYEEETIGETLFQSIHLSMPKLSDPSSLTKKINNNVQSDDKKTEVSVSLGKNYKNLRLRRSRTHKLLIDLKNIETNVAIFTTRDPRKDKTDNSLDYELLNSIDIRLDNIDIFDNVPTSTWNKFLSYMNILGEREIGTSMLNLSILNVRPDPSLVSSEAIIRVSVLPLRLYVDQDTLDFLTRFIEFKDSRFYLPPDEIIYIQKFEMGSLRVKLDYKPKKVDYNGIKSGKAAEFMNFFILDGSDIILPPVKLHGILGFPKLSWELKNTWTPNIQQTQLAGILSGLSPIRSIVNIGGGMKNLVAIPIREYKKDGRLVRSIQKGTSLFAKTTGYEVLNLGAKLASGAQVILEQGEEMFGGEGAAARLPKNNYKSKRKKKEKERPDLTYNKDDELSAKIGHKSLKNNNLLASSQLLNQSIPQQKDQYGSKKLYSYMDLDDPGEIDNQMLNQSLLLLDTRNSQILGIPQPDDDSDSENFHEEDPSDEKLISLYSNQPETIQEGIRLAYQSIGKNLNSTKRKIVDLKQEINNSDNMQETLLSVVKSSPVIIIRPIIGTTEALSKTLMGISNEIDPKHIVESKDKYRWNKPNHDDGD